jgi:hypothetical protein
LVSLRRATTDGVLARPSLSKPFVRRTIAPVRDVRALPSLTHAATSVSNAHDRMSRASLNLIKAFLKLRSVRTRGLRAFLRGMRELIESAGCRADCVIRR